MKQRSFRAAEQFDERVGMALLLLVLFLVMWLFGMLGAFLLDDTLVQGAVAGWRASRPGLELVVVPLFAIAAARWRWGAVRITTLRLSRAGAYLPALMCASLVGLITYLVWSWSTPLTTVGPNEFGLVRWLGTALAAGFTIIWLPLFPRITATLAGMIAGPGLVAVIGYSFFGTHMQVHSPGSEKVIGATLVYGSLAMLLWLVGAINLIQDAWLDRVVRPERQPLTHAIWSGSIMLGLAVLGAAGEF